MSTSTDLPRSILTTAEGLIQAVMQKAPWVFAGLFALIAFVHVTTTVHIDRTIGWLIIACFGAGLMLPRKSWARWGFALGACGLVWVLLTDWYVMANHGFIITYFAIFLTICWVTHEDFWRHGEGFAQFMLMLLMGLALIQKLASPYYMTGNQFADLLLGGEAFLNLLGLFDPGAQETVLQARESVAALEASHAQQSAGLAAPLPELGLVLLVAIYGMTWISILVQGGLEVALAFRKRCGIWLHRYIFVFSLAVYTLRPENVFLSLNLMMGYALTDPASRSMRPAYVIAILYLLGAQLVGFRPLLLR